MFGQLTLKMGNRTTDCDLSPFGLKVGMCNGVCIEDSFYLNEHILFAFDSFNCLMFYI